MSENKTPIGKAIPITLVVILVVAALIGIMTVLGIDMWIPFLGLTLLTGMKIKFDYTNVASFWLSAAVGIFAGHLLTSGLYGVIGLVVGFAVVLLMIFGMTSGRMSFVFNSCTGIFLTATTIPGVAVGIPAICKGLLFGFVVFGLLPCVLMGALAKKNKA